jgi:hypothetical protein
MEWNERLIAEISQSRTNLQFSSKFERLRFAICRDCLGAEIVVRYFQRVEWSGISD